MCTHGRTIQIAGFSVNVTPWPEIKSAAEVTEKTQKLCPRYSAEPEGFSAWFAA